MIRAESDPARIVVGLSVLGALWVLFTLVQRSEPASRMSNDGLAIFAASMAMSATLLLALLCLLSWRVSADQRALDIGIALGFYGCLSLGGGALLPRLLDGDISSRLSASFILAGLPALVQFGAAATRPQIDSGRGWRETITPIAMATTACGVVAFTTCVLVPGFGGPARGLYTTQALAWAVLAMVHAVVAYRTNSHLLHWTAVVATGTGLGLMVSSSEGTFAATGSGVLLATAMGIGLFGVAVTVYRCHADQQRRTLAALVEATLATTACPGRYERPLRASPRSPRCAARHRGRRPGDQPPPRPPHGGAVRFVVGGDGRRGAPAARARRRWLPSARCAGRNVRSARGADAGRLVPSRQRLGDPARDSHAARRFAAHATPPPRSSPACWPTPAATLPARR